jgi:hypothetical protein
MAEPKTEALVHSVENLLAEKEAVAAKEKELIEGLDAVLTKMGYRVVVASAVLKPRGRPPGSGDGRKRRGRPPGSGKGRRRGAASAPKAEGTAPRRRGRPPKEKAESS